MSVEWMSNNFDHSQESATAYVESSLQSEKQLEDVLWGAPGAIRLPPGCGTIVEWIARQFVLPSGIADLVGFTDQGDLVVAELKAIPANKAAVLQVCRYARDLEELAKMKFGRAIPVVKILVASSIDAQTATEAQAVGVVYNQFAPYIAIRLKLQFAHYLPDYNTNRVATALDQALANSAWDKLPYSPSTLGPTWVVTGDTEPFGCEHMPDDYSDIILE